MTPIGTFTTPNGRPISLHIRGDTNDGAMVQGILSTDEYELKGLKLEGWALDIGAHVGAVTFALAADHPNLRIIAVEPVPDNAALLRESVASNGLAERVFIEEAAAGPVGTSTLPCHYAYTAGNSDANYVEQNRFVGNLWRKGTGTGTAIDSPVVTIPGLMRKYHVADFRFAKIDCEGCEWKFLKGTARHIQEIVGEWHDRRWDAVQRLLGATHDLELVTDYGGSGIFRAGRR